MLASQIVANPYGELPMKTAKQASLCEELHLANRKIAFLGDDFQYFINLECLWLNDNVLTGVEGIESNFRLKILYLHGNKIQTIAEDLFAHFIALTTLTLSNNALNDLEGTIASLKRIRNLTTLELFENPIAKEDNYKLRLIGELPGLITFDRHAITPEERHEAKELLKKLAKLKNFKIVQKTTMRKPTLSPDEISDNNKFEDIKIHLRNYLAKTRTSLDPSFLMNDRKKLGFLEDKKFWEILRQYGLVSILSEDEIRIVNLKYRKPVHVHSMSVTGTITKPLIDYRSFCFDISPQELINKIEPYKYKMELVPDISPSTQHLEKFVATIKHNKTQAEIALKKSTMLASAQHSNTNENIFGNNSDKYAPIDTDSTGNLDPWINAALSKILKQNATNAEVSQEQFRTVIELMSKHNYTLQNTVTEAIFDLYDGKEKISIHKVAAALGCIVVLKEFKAPGTEKAAPVAAPAKAKQPSPAPVKDTPAAITTGTNNNNSNSPRPIRLKWRKLTNEETIDLENNLFHKSNKIFDKILRVNGKDSDKLAELTTNVIDLSTSATRLASHKQPIVVEKTHFLPHEIFEKASKRADLIVLPNLLPYSSNLNDEMESDIVFKTNKFTNTFNNKNNGNNNTNNNSNISSLNNSRSNSILSANHSSQHNGQSTQFNNLYNSNATMNLNNSLTRTPFSMSGKLVLNNHATPGHSAAPGHKFGTNNSHNHNNGASFGHSGKYAKTLNGSSGQIPDKALTYKKGWNEGTVTLTIG